MRKTSRVSIMIVAGMLAGGGSISVRAQMPAAPAGDRDLREGMRKLWADHVVWTRVYIIAAVADQPGDTNPKRTRLP